MKQFIITLAVAAMGVLAASAQDKPKDWANFGRYEEANAELSGKQINAVFMGASTMDSWANKVDPDFFSEHNFVCRGISGQTSYQMLMRFRRDVIDLKPEAVVIHAGVNDIARNNYLSVEGAFSNIVSMCELAKVHKIKVVICSLLPCDRFKSYPEVDPTKKVQELNALLKQYAVENKFIYVDFWSEMNNGKGGMDEDLSKDGLHPNMKGYKIMESILLEALKKFKW